LHSTRRWHAAGATAAAAPPRRHVALQHDAAARGAQLGVRLAAACVRQRARQHARAAAVECSACPPPTPAPCTRTPLSGIGHIRAHTRAKHSHALSLRAGQPLVTRLCTASTKPRKTAEQQSIPYHHASAMQHSTGWG
jgi:hypothetical protein